MRPGIDAGEIGDESLIAIGFGIEDERALLPLELITKTLGSEEDAEFERHIESRKAGVRIKLGARQIVDTKAALLDNPIEFVDPGLAAVIHFARTSDAKTAGEHREHQRLKSWRKLIVEWAVYEDVPRDAARHGYFA